MHALTDASSKNLHGFTAMFNAATNRGAGPGAASGTGAAHVSNFNDREVTEISKAQLLLLDKLNLQNIIDNKNMAHAMTALDLLRLEGYDVHDPVDLRSFIEVRMRSRDGSNENMSTSDFDSTSQVRLSHKYSKRPQYLSKK